MSTLLTYVCTTQKLSNTCWIRVLCCTPAILATEGPRQEDHNFSTSLGSTEGPCFKFLCWTAENNDCLPFPPLLENNFFNIMISSFYSSQLLSSTPESNTTPFLSFIRKPAGFYWMMIIIIIVIIQNKTKTNTLELDGKKNRRKRAQGTRIRERLTHLHTLESHIKH